MACVRVCAHYGQNGVGNPRTRAGCGDVREPRRWGAETDGCTTDRRAASPPPHVDALAPGPSSGLGCPSAKCIIAPGPQAKLSASRPVRQTPPVLTPRPQPIRHRFADPSHRTGPDPLHHPTAVAAVGLRWSARAGPGVGPSRGLGGCTLPHRCGVRSRWVGYRATPGSSREQSGGATLRRIDRPGPAGRCPVRRRPSCSRL